MNKKELNEVRKTITNVKDTTLSKISICYVSSEKEKVLTETLPFLSIPKEESFKYLDIFKKALSGGFNKSLFHIEMQDGNKERNLLCVLQDSNKVTIDTFYDEIIENYNFAGSYLIVVGHGFYDYPNAYKDGTYAEDSENTYEYMLTAVCPVTLSKPSLSYKDGAIIDRIRDWIVEPPKDAFLFPTFTDRESNVHEVLYYAKNSKEHQEDLLEFITGNQRPNSESEDKELLSDSICQENEMGCSFEVVKEFHEKAREIILETEENKEIFKSADELFQMFEDSGMNDEEAKNIKEIYKQNNPAKEISLNNLVNPNKTTIKGTGFDLKIDSGKLPEIKTLHIDGRTCLVLPLDSSELEVNGIVSMAKILN